MGLSSIRRYKLLTANFERRFKVSWEETYKKLRMELGREPKVEEIQQDMLNSAFSQTTKKED